MIWKDHFFSVKKFLSYFLDCFLFLSSWMSCFLLPSLVVLVICLFIIFTCKCNTRYLFLETEYRHNLPVWLTTDNYHKTPVFTVQFEKEPSNTSEIELTSRQDFPRCMSYNLYIRYVGKCSFYILVFSKSANTAIVGKFSFFMCLSVHIFSVLKGEGCTNFFMLAKHFIWAPSLLWNS